MAREEILDPVSGAILFKRDQESINLEKAISTISEMEKMIATLEKKVKKLEKLTQTSE